MELSTMDGLKEIIMAKKLKFALLVLATLSISALTTTVNAKIKPPKVEDIILSAGPVVGGIFTCDIRNHTDQPIAYEMEWCSGPRTTPGTTPSCGIATGSLQPYANYGVGDLGGSFNAEYATDCTVVYSGLAGDITGVLCGTSGCVPLN